MMDTANNDQMRMTLQQFANAIHSEAAIVLKGLDAFRLHAASRVQSTHAGAHIPAVHTFVFWQHFCWCMLCQVWPCLYMCVDEIAVKHTLHSHLWCTPAYSVAHMCLRSTDLQWKAPCTMSGFSPESESCTTLSCLLSHAIGYC